jgi:hypothetical protein
MKISVTKIKGKMASYRFYDTETGETISESYFKIPEKEARNIYAKSLEKSIL